MRSIDLLIVPLTEALRRGIGYAIYYEDYEYNEGARGKGHNIGCVIQILQGGVGDDIGV